MQFQKSLLTATLLAAASLTAVSASAADTADFEVKIKIISACNFTTTTAANDIDFGSVAAGSPAAANKTSSTALSVMCSTGAPYKVNLKPVSTGNDDGTGFMTGPAPTDKINYKLNKDAAGAEAWGVGVLGSTDDGVSGTGEGMSAAKAISHPVYATLTGANATDVTVGDYSDTVNVSVLY